ncbi:MAG: hypothetical protein ABI852_11675 [Gemmatimonadaceae bacterium]
MISGCARIGLITVLAAVGCDSPGAPTGQWYDGPWYATRVDGVDMPALYMVLNGHRVDVSRSQ